MATGRKRGIVISLILHIILLLCLIYLVSLYPPTASSGTARKQTGAQVSFIKARSPQSSAQGSGSPPSAPPTTQPLQEASRAATMILPPPQSQETTAAPQEKPVATLRRRPSSAGWYAPKTESSDEEKLTMRQRTRSVIPTAMDIITRPPKAAPDAGEVETLMFEISAYGNKLKKAFKQTAIFFERTTVSEREFSRMVKGYLRINDAGIITEVHLSTPSGDQQADSFIKEFFLAAQIPPLPARLQGQAFTFPFIIECNVKPGRRAMRMLIRD